MKQPNNEVGTGAVAVVAWKDAAVKNRLQSTKLSVLLELGLLQLLEVEERLVCLKRSLMQLKVAKVVNCVVWCWRSMS